MSFELVTGAEEVPELGGEQRVIIGLKAPDGTWLVYQADTEQARKVATRLNLRADEADVFNAQRGAGR